MAEVRAGELGRRCHKVRWEDGMIHGTIRRVREGETERNQGVEGGIGVDVCCGGGGGVLGEALLPHDLGKEGKNIYIRK